MQVIDVTVNDIKKCKNLEEDIRTNVIGKYNYSDISLNEIAEFINENDDLKLHIFYPDSLNKEALISYLKDKVHKETINRIKTGEIDIIKKALSPYMSFISGTKNLDKILEILNVVFNQLKIQDEDEILKEAFDKIEIISQTIKTVCQENKDKILAKDYSFIKNNIMAKFIKLYFFKLQNPNSINETEITELDKKIKNNVHAQKIKQYLLENHISLRYIYIILLRYSIFDYERESLESLSSYFGISKVRIALDQDKAILELFNYNLIDNICKLCPHPKETRRYLNEIYKNGFSEDIILDVKEPKLSMYTQNLCVLTNTTTDELIKLVEKLNFEDQNFIKDNYNTDYELKNKITAERMPIMAVVKKLIRLQTDKTYKPINNKNSNLSLKLNIDKESLTEILKKFTLIDQNFIYSLYDKNFNHINSAKNNHDKVRLNNLINDIKTLITNPEYDPKHFKNLYKRIGINRDELEKVILKLSQAEQNALINWYDENWNEKHDNQLGADKRRISQIVVKIKLLLKPKKQKIIKPNYLYEYYEASKEDLDAIIIKLSSEDQNFLHLYYDDNYIFKDNLPVEEETSKLIKNNLKRIKMYIRKLIKDPNYLSKKVKTKSQGKTLYQLLNISLEELEEIIKKLSIKDQSLLQENYDENFYRIKHPELDRKDYLKLNGKLYVVRTKITRLHNDPNYNIRNGIKKEITKVPSKGKTLYEVLGISIAELETVIAKLSEHNQNLLRDNYDKEYYRIKYPQRTREEQISLNSKLYILRKKMLKIHENPDYSISENKKQERDYITLNSSLGITKEELILLINKLPQEDQDLLNEAYDSEYRIIRQKVTNEKEAQARRSKLSYIRKKLRNLQMPKTDKRKRNLSRVLDISPKKLKSIIKKLSASEQQIVYGIYTDEFEPIDTTNLTEKEIIQNRNKMAGIRAKIRIYIENPNYRPKRGNISLCKRLNTDFITTNKLIGLLNEKDKNLILSAYDELDEYSRKQSVPSEEAKTINTLIIPKLKRYLSNGMQTKRVRHKSASSIESILDITIFKQDTNNSFNILELIIMTSIASGEQYSISSIAKFLGMEESTVSDMIKNYLINAQEKYNKAIEEHLKSFEKPMILERQLPNKKEEN